MIEGIDQSLGDIIQHVKDLGLGENTLILFLGDNGSDAPLPIEEGYSSSVPLKGKKGNHWEGGMRVPFIASWVSLNATHSAQVKIPIATYRIQQQQGTILDILPTLLQVAQVDAPNDHILDGFALQKQFLGEQNPNRTEQFLNHFPHGQHRSNYFTSFVLADWKLIYHYPIDTIPQYELYHLKADPFETTNLANSNPQQLKVMIQALTKQMEDYGALYPEKDGEELGLVVPE
ncbi:MAG: sulfatase-like hydrolase/transferase [Cytophagales bacterium]|nr:sulfatase-like hydrolase/transferase [Cytophagales bacterium]